MSLIVGLLMQLMKKKLSLLRAFEEADPERVGKVTEETFTQASPGPTITTLAGKRTQ
jgi:hypothetical protein